MGLITYPDKSTGDSFTAVEATEIKDIVNKNVGVTDGMVGDGATDNFAIIQAAMDANDKVIIGQSISEIYIISQPLYINTNNHIVVNGTVKLQDGIIRDLTADAPADQIFVDIANADTYFSAGQWVCISDDDAPLAGGSISGLRDHNIGNSVKVASVTSTRVTFESDLYYSYTTAANAKIGHLQSCFIAQNVDDWIIEGDGVIDGNSSTMYNVEPVGDFGHGLKEEALAGSAITVENSDGFKIRNITGQNGGLHNFAFLEATNFSVSGVTSINTHDKSMLLWNTSGGTLENIFINGSRYEDGITLYDFNDQIKLFNIYSKDVKRAHFHFLDDATNINASFLSASGTGIGIFTGASKGINISNVNIFDSTGAIALGATEDITINGLLIDCSKAGHGYALSVGAVKNLIVNGGTIYDSFSSSGQGWGIHIAATADRVFVHNLLLHNMKRPEEVEAGATEIHFFNLAFTDCFNNGNQANVTVHDIVIV